MYPYDQVAGLFSDFNDQYYKLREVFQDVTQQVFKPGQEAVLEELRAEVMPVKMDDLLFLGRDSDADRAETNRFLKMNNLEMLQKTFLDEGVILKDLYNMEIEEMKTVGVTMFADRKQLKAAVEAHKSSSNSTSGQAGTATTAQASKEHTVEPRGAEEAGVAGPVRGRERSTKPQQDTVDSSSSAAGAEGVTMHSSLGLVELSYGARAQDETGSGGQLGCDVDCEGRCFEKLHLQEYKSIILHTYLPLALVHPI